MFCCLFYNKTVWFLHVDDRIELSADDNLTTLMQNQFHDVTVSLSQ